MYLTGEERVTLGIGRTDRYLGHLLVRIPSVWSGRSFYQEGTYTFEPVGELVCLGVESGFLVLSSWRLSMSARSWISPALIRRIAFLGSRWVR